MDSEGRRKRHRQSRRLERMMLGGGGHGAAYSVRIVGSTEA